MKMNKIQILIVLFLFAIAANGQEAITVSGTKFTYPLIEKWISEYKKENPEAQFKLISKKNESAPSDISIIAHQPLKTDVTDINRIVYVNKYALLPVTGSSNKYLKDIKKRGLNKKELEKLFFQETDLEENPEEKTQKPVGNPVNIYSRESQASSSIAFASYFGFQSSEIKGKKVSGDDIYLISSIRKDSTGVTFNNLGYLFDLQTRKLREGIVLLPLDIDEKAKTLINTNVDDALTTIENTKFETIPVERVGFIFNKNPDNKEILNFVKWVIGEGQKFNHEYGFLNLDKKLQADQVAKLTETYLTVK